MPRSHANVIVVADDAATLDAEVGDGACGEGGEEVAVPEPAHGGAHGAEVLDGGVRFVVEFYWDDERGDLWQFGDELVC